MALYEGGTIESEIEHIKQLQAAGMGHITKGEDYIPIQEYLDGLQKLLPPAESQWFQNGVPNSDLLYGSGGLRESYNNDGEVKSSGGTLWGPEDVYGPGHMSYRNADTNTGVDSSWLTYAEQRGYPQDYRKATEDQKAHFYEEVTYPLSQMTKSPNGLGFAWEGLKSFMSTPPMIGLGLVAGGMGLAGMGGAGGAAAGAGSGGFAGADALGLAQMGQAAGLSGGALDAFIASGGALGSAAAGGGGIGLGAAGGAFNYGAADQLGLQQMGQAAGLQGQALQDFISSGGTLGSTAAGGGGLLNNLPSTPSTGGGGAGGAGGVGGNGTSSGGTDAVGSDWATGQATGAAGGLLPQTAGGLTAANGAGTATTALQRIMSGTGTTADWASIAGTAGSTILGMYNESQKNSDQKALADQYMAFGAPSRARYEGSFAPGFSMANEPGYKDALDSTSDSLLRKLSATGGNPYGNPGGLIEANKAINSSLALPALNNFRNQNAATGGYGAFNTAAPGAASNAINSSGGALTTLAGGLSDILNPKPQNSLADLLKNSGYKFSLA